LHDLWPILYHQQKNALKKEKPMPQKVYIKPPAPTGTMLIAQMVVVSLFLPLGPVFVFVAEGDARPFVALFALIWVAACIAILIYSAKTLKLVKAGKIEIAELGDGDQPRDSAFAQRLRDLDALKKEGLVSDAEYQTKREQILLDKW
jgi:hypothetical protein